MTFEELPIKDKCLAAIAAVELLYRMKSGNQFYSSNGYRVSVFSVLRGDRDADIEAFLVAINRLIELGRIEPAGSIKSTVLDFDIQEWKLVDEHNAMIENETGSKEDVSGDSPADRTSVSAFRSFRERFNI